ncbi:MAG: DinB family protein [Kordia sp.]|uniref:DinB family protein n=1 Tax=Kordia sp. TaxID=1965332 RepID=UPI00385AFE5D
MNYFTILTKKQLICFLVISFFTFTNLHAQNQYWTLFAKSIKMSTDVKLKFKITASIKVDTNDPDAWAGIWARVDTKNDETGFFDNMQDRAVVTNTWDTYVINGYIDKNSESLNFGGLCLFNGKFYFDNVKLFVENKATGKFDEIKLDNYDFEKTIVGKTVRDWDHNDIALRNPKNEKFSFSLVKDDPSKNLSLCIIGSDIKIIKTKIIGEREGYTPQIGTLVSMLNNLSHRVERTVKNLDQRELDHLHDEKANSIGALIMHLAAAEKIYQLYTFENRGFNEEEEKFWGPALSLDDAGRETYKGHDVEYYLNIYREVRAVTLAELKKRDDSWLQITNASRESNNHYYWFHVMEHQSSHLGQILFLKKRIPPASKINIEQKKKID